MSLGVWVALASIVLILTLSTLVHITQVDGDMGFLTVFWTMLLQALAPNPVDVNLGPWQFLLVMLLITLMGIFMVSIFIGIITTSLENKVQSLRKGRSKIIEKGHTVILGWDEHIFTILSELAITNQNHKHACIAILGEKDKVEMEDEIRLKVASPGRTEIVCRSGSSIDMDDLELVSVNTAKSIIVLAPDGDDADICVTKTLLAITNNPQRHPWPYHVVTEIHDPFNLDAAHLAGKDEAIILLISDIIAHIIAQTCRQSGLSAVYTELLNFEGDEIYFKEDPSLVGRTFEEALFLYEDSAVIGILPLGGRPKLNPPMNAVIRPDDQLIVVSADDESIHLSGIKTLPVSSESIILRDPDPTLPERTLILGWNKRGPTILTELDHYVSPGSVITVVSNQIDPALETARFQSILKNQAVAFQPGNYTDRQVLQNLCVETYRHVIILADLDGVTAQLADARTLMALLHLRDIDDRAGHRYTIVSEMLDVRNRKLAEVTHADDFIVSDELASLLMAQISENKNMYQVYEDLFYPEGSEIYLKPIYNYIHLDQPVNFYTLVEAARRRGEVALGYRINAQANYLECNFGVVINPEKSRSVAFHENDRLIVLAEW